MCFCDPEHFAGSGLASRQDILSLSSNLRIFFNSIRCVSFLSRHLTFWFEFRDGTPPAWGTAENDFNMDSGYYAACAGLAAQTQALELVAHNLANLSTTGYRGQQTTFRSLLVGSGAVNLNPLNVAVNNFGVLSGSRLDMSQGSPYPTGNPLDVAMAGPGFFVVQAAPGVLYTRDGSFHVTGTGLLVTGQGNSVLGQQGPITVPTGNLAISSDGTISVDGAVVDKLQLAEFSPATNLTAMGNATYSAPPNSALVPANSTVRQGMLEGSNVSPMESVVQMITVQRNADMLARALTAFDSQFNQIGAQDLPKV
jgi:flagellar basal-body rod protein FlgF/flagellar basal-body rod protein FlgG